MTRRDLQDYFAGTYVPRNLVVAAAGSVQHDDFVKLVMQHFEGVGRPVDEPATLAPPRIQPVSHRREKDLEQTQLVLGTEAPSIEDKDRFPAYVLDAVLGGNLSSRLFQVIREERGLAYSVYSSLACFREVGCFSVYAGTSPENLNEVLDCVLAELERIKRIPVPEEEIARAKDHLRGSILMGTEGSASKMAQIARQEIYYGREVPDPEIIEAIDRVTANDLIRMANDWFQAPLSVTVVGRLDGLKPFPEKWVA